MGIFVQFLLMFLPKLLEWLLARKAEGTQLTGSKLDKINNITWLCAQIAETSPSVGCTLGGTPPPAMAVPDEQW